MLEASSLTLSNMPLAFSLKYQEFGQIDTVKKILHCLTLILPCSLSLSSGHMPPNLDFKQQKLLLGVENMLGERVKSGE